MRANQKNEVFYWIKLFTIALIFALIVRSFIFSPIIVDGDSMNPTLRDQDQMIVNKFIYHFQEPKRFDIVIFHAPEEKDFIKRVIGLPGERVEVKNNQLYINDTVIKQPFLEPQADFEMEYPIVTYDFTLESITNGKYKEIPEGYILVLGDNRVNSKDSRWLGLISEDQIVGKTELIYWPMNRMQIVKE